MLQGVSYVQDSAVYIRSLIPEEWDLTLFGVLGLSGRGYADFHAGAQPMGTMPYQRVLGS